MAEVKAIPEGYPQVTPYLHVDDAAKAIEFYTSVFEGKERVRMDAPEVEIGDSLIMLADEFPELNIRGPRSIGGTSVTINVYVEEVDAVHGRALAQGAKEIRPVENQFYGDRSGQFEDPFGHLWNVSSHVEDVPPEEMQRRSQEAMEAMGG
jgi:PhnB protein